MIQKLTTLFAAVAMTASLLEAQELPYWKDTQVTGINAETRRTEVIYFADRNDALVKGFRESENYLSLNGTWDFKYYEDHHRIPAPGAKVAWDSIRVPGNWEVQGWGTAIYVNHPYDFCPVDPQPPQLPEVFPGALYHRTFTVPERWQGRRIFLNLCGVKSGTYVYVNGREIGYGEDSKSLARYDITDAVIVGENELLLKVLRYSTGSYLECQDFWRISGIERDVYLSSEKTACGFDFSIVSTLDEERKNGIFRMKMRSDAPADVFYELIDQDGKTVADARFEFSGEMATITDVIPDVRQWTAETPQLYTLLLQVNGEYTRFHVGFRRIEIAKVKDGDREVKALLVNGQPVKFKGVNLHEHNPWTGHYLTRENILEDLLLMRRANINAIRTCHYPQPREFYELCDSLGFYVYDEANVESHGMGYAPERTLGNKSEWYPKHIDRILNMYHRTANYPCVTILSLGNEAGDGVIFTEAYKVLKALEKDGQNRPVVYERAEYKAHTDMIVPQYPDADWFRSMGEKYAERPVCPSEYAHAMGNSTGSLDLQWNQIYAHTHLQGGFIWDWVDQGLYDKERGWTYGGDYGENAPSDGNFLCNDIVNPDREPHPAFYEVKHVYQDIHIAPVNTLKGIFSVQNRFYFKDLKPYTIRWRVERDGRRIRRGKLHFDTPAQGIDTFRVRLPRMGRKAEYRIIFETENAFDAYLLKNARLKEKFRTGGKALQVVDGDAEIRIANDRVQLVFDKVGGYVKSWKVKGRNVIEEGFGLRPNFWRAPVDNDYGNKMPQRCAAWKEASEGFSCQATALKQEDGSVRLSALYTLPDACTEVCQMTLYPSGVMTVGMDFRGGSVHRDLPRIGLRMRLADETFSYFGRGPVENYCDRFTGTHKSLYRSTASAEYYPYVRPQETGHHTDTDWLQLKGLRITAEAPFEFNVLRQRVEDLDGGPVKAQTHLSDVPTQPFTEVCIDGAMTGVGGYDSWGAWPESSRTLWTDRSYQYNFTLIPSR